jgi:hypothetical protein
LDASVDLAEDEAERDELVARRERDAQDAELEQALGHAAWVKHLAALTAQVEETQARIEHKLRQFGRPDRRRVIELRQEWESGAMSMDEKRAHLASAIQAVFVRPGRTSFGGTKTDPELRRAKLGKRVHIVWATDLPLDDVPRQGRVGYVAKPWEFPSDPDEVGVMPLRPELEDPGDAVR